MAASPGVRVLMLSWEYPPLVVGGLGRHVDALSRALVAAGHDVCVVTRGSAAEPMDEFRDGVRVVRAALDPLEIDFTTESLIAWSQAAEHSLIRAVLPAVRRWRPDVVHAHDWLVAQTAVTVAQALDRPLVVTVHAMELGRHQGWLPEPMNRAIHSIERWLAREADSVIVCSRFMRDEVVTRLQVTPASVAVIPNGIDPTRWRATPSSRRSVRARFGEPPLLVYTGRLVHEKGVQTVLAALPVLRARHPGLRLIVAGTGPYLANLQARARRLRIVRSVTWAGFVPDEDLPALFATADVTVVPSLYEPFGLVALEAAAAGARLAVSETGGLADLVVPGRTGARFAADDPSALAHAVSGLLADPVAARLMARRGTRAINRTHTWNAVADRTAAEYTTVGAASTTVDGGSGPPRGSRGARPA